MSFEDLSKPELISILELVEEAGRCADRTGIRELVLKARGLFEAEYAVCGIIGAGANPPAECFGGNYPEQWASRYMGEKLYLSDPVVRYISSFAMTQLWTDIFKHYDDERARKLLSDAGDYGIRFGLTGGVYLPEANAISVFSFSGGSDRFGRHHKRIMDMLVLHLNGALMRAAGHAGRGGHQPFSGIQGV